MNKGTYSGHIDIGFGMSNKKYDTQDTHKFKKMGIFDLVCKVDLYVIYFNFMIFGRLNT